MIGRSYDEERGQPHRATSANSMSSSEDRNMGQATRCVRRFAPNGVSQSKRSENRHITACKISDAYPNELIASWSGDHIYSFDIIRSQSNNDAQAERGPKASNRRNTKGSKRKRNQNGSSTSMDSEHKSSKSQRAKETQDDAPGVIRAVYENGETQDLPLRSIPARLPASTLEHARDGVLTEPQIRSLRIAKGSVKIRKLIFSLEASSHDAKGSMDPVAHQSSFLVALRYSARYYGEMKAISTSWRYPVDPTEFDIAFQQTLRANRTSSQHFIQAAGTLARLLSGKLCTDLSSESLACQDFNQVLPVEMDRSSCSREQMFLYTFLKAIILWLEGGIPSLIKGFQQPTNQRRNPKAFPLPDNADAEHVSNTLIPHLLSFAHEAPLISVDASRFEHDSTQKLFETETAAVVAFSHVIQMPVIDVPDMIATSSKDESVKSSNPSQQKRAALNYWGFKVGRSILLKAGEDVDFQFVDNAFGGLGLASDDDDRARDVIDPDEEDPVVEKAYIIAPSTVSGNENSQTTTREIIIENEALMNDVPDPDGTTDQDETSDDGETGGAESSTPEEEDNNPEGNDDEDEDDDYEDDGFDDDDDEDEVEANGDEDEGHPFIFQSAFERRRDRQRVEVDVPCYSHTRTYRGHCNVKTVKDVNFFGLQDEYVVSGSDSGHLFIWDKRTSELVNILKGDSQVVNVIQGTSLLRPD